MAPLLASLAGLACTVDELPTDLDGVVHHLLQHQELGTDDELARSVLNLDAAIQGARLREPLEGSLSRLSLAEATLLGVSGADPAKAAGIFLGNLVACDPVLLETILTWPEQDAIYPGVYEHFERTYDGSIDAFLAGDVDSLRWSLDYSASVLGSTYTGHTQSLMRRVRTPEGVEAPFSTAVLVRYVAPAPATFEEGSNLSYTQDYQFEVYWSRAPGETLHAYAMWREADWGAGLTSESEAVQKLLLSGMATWDEDTEAICAAGGPAAFVEGP